MDEHVGSEPLPGEPSWTTALSEADAASRHLRLATTSMGCLSHELRALHERGETTARLDLARALTAGSDGGPLNALVAAASDPAGHPSLRRTAEILVERLAASIGLAPVGTRGELLRLRPEDLVEFEVRGRPSGSIDPERRLYCVVRPGWTLDALIVARPLIEAVSEGDATLPPALSSRPEPRHAE
jgi:hypothetical protein